MTMRLVHAEDGWWCLAAGKVAHLPTEAVEAGELTTEARNALHPHGFFEPATRPYAVTVLTATSCNLGCSYCFQNVGGSAANPFAPQRIARSLLNKETIREAAAFVQLRMHELSFDDVSLLLFGGEPLLNPQGCLGILRALQPLGLTHAEMISNTVLLRPRLARDLYDAGLRRIQVTFDGGREQHDQIRVDHRGGVTYDRILQNVQDAGDATELDWHFRVNISHHTLAGVSALIDDLAALNLPQSASVHLALIDDIGIGYENKISCDASLAKQFIGLVDHAFDAGLTVPVTGNSLKDCPFCGEFAGGTGAVINADGTLFSCWETAGRTDWAVGDIRNGYLPNDQIKHRWVACDYAAASHGRADEVRAFHDAIDAHILGRTYRPHSVVAG
ncbi:radical SAM protein [Micromonospora wenchangensis]|uniref:radical SAM protein n=1 Tax=Micromonospora wenchangensis TaxID=1185415 RepID=UPI0037FD49B6